MLNRSDPPALRRRDFLRWLAASPLLPYLSGCDVASTAEALAQEMPAQDLQELAATSRFFPP